jgi:hypothetical protein
VKTGYLDIEVWNGKEWIAQPEHRVTVLSSTKKTTVTVDFEQDIQYTRVRLTYTDNGGSGIAFDAFKATCAQNLTYIYRGKELMIDASLDAVSPTYEITGLTPNTTYNVSMQSSDITKGCEEHISALSEPLKVTTVAIQEGDKDENRLPLVVDYTNYDQPTPIVYISNPMSGSLLKVYDINGALVYSCPVQDGISDYAIPSNKLKKNCLYLVKYLEGGKMKRKQSWAKFIY